ncbi:hypothetical protein Q9L58_010833, partial [Maublancomyces gigas]
SARSAGKHGKAPARRGADRTNQTLLRTAGAEISAEAGGVRKGENCYESSSIPGAGDTKIASIGGECDAIIVASAEHQNSLVGVALFWKLSRMTANEVERACPQAV